MRQIVLQEPVNEDKAFWCIATITDGTVKIKQNNPVEGTKQEIILAHDEFQKLIEFYNKE